MGHKTVVVPPGNVVTIKECCPQCDRELTKNGYCRSCKTWFCTVQKW